MKKIELNGAYEYTERHDVTFFAHLCRNISSGGALKDAGGKCVF